MKLELPTTSFRICCVFSQSKSLIQKTSYACVRRYDSFISKTEFMVLLRVVRHGQLETEQEIHLFLKQYTSGMLSSMKYNSYKIMVLCNYIPYHEDLQPSSPCYLPLQVYHSCLNFVSQMVNGCECICQVVLQTE